MNYIYERMEAGGETAIFDRADLRKFEGETDLTEQNYNNLKIM